MEQPKIAAADTTTIPSSTVTTKGMGKTIGSSGTTITGGIISGEEYNRKLTGKFAIRQYEVMRRSESSVEGALEVIKQPILNVDHTLQPAITDNDEAAFRARYMKRELFDRNIDFHQLTEEAMTFLDFGHAVAEFTLELTEFEGRTLIGIQEIGFRKQISIDRWETVDHKPGITQILNVTPQDGGSNTRSIPRQKLLIWTNKKEGDNDAGISLLRFAFKDWDMKDKLGIVHAVGLEKMAIPTPVISVPAGADETDKANARNSLRQYRANEEGYIEKPVGWELDKLDMTGQTMQQVLPALQYYDRQMFVSVLAAFQALGSTSGSGSRAVGDVQYKPYIQKVATINRRFVSPIQQFIKLLCDLNFTDNSDGYPELQTARFQDDDITALSSALASLSNAGMITPDPDLEQHLRETMHLPDLSDDLRADYEEKRQAAKEAAKRLAENPIDPNAPVDPKDDKGNKDPKADPTKDDLSNEKDKKPTKASAIADAKVAQRRLIDVLVG